MRQILDYHLLNPNKDFIDTNRNDILHTGDNVATLEHLDASSLITSIPSFIHALSHA